MIEGYLDNAATTALCDASKNAMTAAMDCFGNPSSLHSLGVESAKIIDNAKAEIAGFIKCEPNEILFTSGGTESDNLAIFGAVNALKRRGNKIVTTAFEHSAVISPMKELEKQGFEVVYLLPDSNGEISEESVENAVDENTILVSIMWMNNETGAVLPIEKIKSIIKRKNSPALFHCDATQGFGKYTIFPAKIGIDLLTASAHKIHGPKGIGMLYIKKGVRILPLICGGEQQNGLRPGTEPTILIAGFSAAVADIGNITENLQNAKAVKNYLVEKLEPHNDVVINSPKNASDFVLNLSVLGIRSETMLHFCEQRKVYISSGSACAKGKASHVLKALGLDKKRADSALRISMSKFSTIKDAEMLINAINDARQTLVRSK